MKAVNRRTLIGGVLGANVIGLGALAGCVAQAKLAPAGPFDASALHVTLGRNWSDLTPVMRPRPENVHYLSIDGPLLNRLYLGAGLAPGQSLVRPLDRDAPRPTFRADMTDGELVEFVVDCVAAMGYLAPETASLRPQDLGGTLGTRFEINTTTAEGLNVTGTALTARMGERLHVLLFLAPGEHYYGALLPEVESVFGSARLTS
jgi:hypothetical protein